MTIGVIAEDNSDVGVVRAVTLSLVSPRRVGFSRFVGDGCGKLHRKCGAWARILVRQGCQYITVVHDLDMNDEERLRAELSDAIAPAGARLSVVLIPRREIEAWLLYDGKAIAAAFNEREEVKLPANPESLLDPKKHLRDLIWRKYRKEYLNTIHNARIAEHIDVSLLGRSASFTPHFAFTTAVRRGLG